MREMLNKDPIVFVQRKRKCNGQQDCLSAKARVVLPRPLFPRNTSKVKRLLRIVETRVCVN
jgi:hypothetical protein